MSEDQKISNALIYAINNGYQVHPDAFTLLRSLDDVEKIIKMIIDKQSKLKKKSLILIDDIRSVLSQNKESDKEFNGISFVDEKTKMADAGVSKEDYKIIFDPTSKINIEEVEGFSRLFQSRYKKSLKILSARPESKQVRKIEYIRGFYNKSKLESLSEKNSKLNDSVFVAGLIMYKRSRKNNIEITIDDVTGSITGISKKQEVVSEASRLVLDQMVMLKGSLNKINQHEFLIRDIISPDIPEHIPNRARSESYVVLISDLHVGSKYFMENEFSDFLNWLSSSDDIVKKIKFICIAGDIIEGIGIFPNQEKELVEINMHKQILHAAKLLERIPKRLHIFLIPGNHDPGRRALPQASFSSIEIFNSLENFSMIGNPSFVELSGIKVLMYHGQSLDDIIATIPGSSYSKPVEAMKILLKTRHLSPMYGSRTPIAPEIEDMLVIDEVPDIFHAGHIHITDVGRYKGTLLVNSGAWQQRTNYQRTVGIVPTPGIAILVNLATLQPFKKNFNYQHLE